MKHPDKDSGTMLVSFCNDIAKITTRAELTTVVGDGLRKLGIDKYLLSEVSDDHAAGATDELPGIPLRFGTRNIGVLYTERNSVDAELLQAITSQISTALACIIANEETEKQSAQIENLKKELLESRSWPDKTSEAASNDSQIIGTSESMQKVLRLVSQVSKTQSTVLLLGETGTGKEVIAKAIHQNSWRKDEVMVTVNCAALPASLIESELFGHEKGSFTGAAERRIGKWELAHNGTLFLDEIGDMPLDLQVKLLRALQEKEIERVGGRTPIKTDVRVIAATNKDLQNEVNHGNFRSDLFFRLNIFPITIPPLRERGQDIAALALHFAEKYAKRSGRKISGISSRVLKKLSSYRWPGNVRELENLMERSVLLSSKPIINQLHLPVGEENIASVLENTRVKTMDEVDREHIMRVLKSCKGKVAGSGGAAEALKMPPTTLHSMIKRLGIRKQYPK
ncbi:sigma-54 interaction domain-containing protein [Dyadobacter fanqingshengii]|uniref:Sigma 54-interacting transcriptional regulator n=1 Tax=Dyadobacter fanqingshengii TaxID=2906443 RepID=A0A9X1P7D4_9BACT|nr:sigma 54-interacting transcriptional regulator [Dyadobacter fanqingshengii]MCF0039716.1 sigma 54-interacting transcriptional regulator [Dyadobacter fanqingshengii]USJ38521.1 sigma 54-interacting transcriptional regulator [Dyadobacter fanqingshengii]